MSLQIYIDGEFYSKEEAKVSFFDHGLLYGDGVFEGIRFYKKNIFRFKEHLERLYDSAHYIMLKIPHNREEMTAAIVDTCRRSGLEDGYIRLVVTRGVGDLGISPFTCKNPSVIIIVAGIRLYDQKYYDEGLKIVTSSFRRVAADAMSPRVKSLNYLNNIMAKIQCQQSGALEALMLDPNGFIVECTADNFFIVRDNCLFTPPTYQGALRGITRDAVIDIARNEGMTVREERLTLYEAYTAKEAFLTGTAAEVCPVVSIDGREIGDGKPGPITKSLEKKFREITQTDGLSF